MRKKIGLVGFFGWGNFGDELFLEAHRQHLEKYYDLQVMHDIYENPYYSRDVNRVVDEYDGIVIGGGDLLNVKSISQLYWKIEYLQKPVFVFGIGVPFLLTQPQENMRRYAGFFSHPNCKFVATRDAESCKWMNENFSLNRPALWFPDAVCSMSLPQASPAGANEKILGVTVRYRRGTPHDLSPVRALIEQAKDYGYSIRHLVLGHERTGQLDLEVARQFAKADEEIRYSSSPLEMCGEISNCSMLASMKFHGVVVAAMYGIPALALSNSLKNKYFLDMIERPELFRDYKGAKDLAKRVPFFPASVPSAVVQNLRKRSAEGYIQLLDALERYISPAGSERDKPAVMEEPSTSVSLNNLPAEGTLSPDKQRYDYASLVNRASGRIKELPRRLGVTPAELSGARILEVGCGIGESTDAVMRMFAADAYGVDIDPHWRGREFQHLERQGRLHVYDITRKEVLSLGKFAYIHSYTVFEHIDNPRKALETIFELLSPGGFVFLNFLLYLGASASHLLGFLPDKPWIHLTHTENEARKIMMETYRLDKGFAYVNTWRASDYINNCEEAGFSVIKHWYAMRQPDADFQKRYREIIDKYTVDELSKNTMSIVLTKK